MTDTNQDLERFRQEWREEVTARAKGKGQGAKPEAERTGYGSTPHGGRAGKAPPAPKSSVAKKDDYDETEPKAHHDRSIDSVDWEVHVSGGDKRQEPRSALEHYERGVEREDQGNLGDSLSHYRKAYKSSHSQLDSSVEKTYKKKYFTGPSTSSKVSSSNPSNASVTVPNPAHHSLQGPSLSASSISELIDSFSSLSIIPTASPSVPEDSPPPPCPISTVPSEVLIEILTQVALLDLSSFVRLAQVCKRLAFLVSTEQRIWRRLCCGWEFGFGGMHYRWACDVFGQPFDDADQPPTYLPVPLTPLYPTYTHNLRHRPRIRFNGCYISTVNYVRPGATSVTQVSWNSPVHIVTYYRYLRFFRDGTVISLLTTTEPIDVVHQLTKENLPGPNSNPNTLRSALRGRWKLSGDPLSSSSKEEEDEEEGNVTIETEGVDPVKYMYLMHLSLPPTTTASGSGGGAASRAKNNKLVWRGFWSYNRLTDDWAEFGLKNDRPFWWSRVRSYGMG